MPLPHGGSWVRLQRLGSEYRLCLGSSRVLKVHCPPSPGGDWTCTYDVIYCGHAALRKRMRQAASGAPRLTLAQLPHLPFCPSWNKATCPSGQCDPGSLAMGQLMSLHVAVLDPRLEHTWAEVSAHQEPVMPTMGAWPWSPCSQRAVPGCSQLHHGSLVFRAEPQPCAIATAWPPTPGGDCVEPLACRSSVLGDLWMP